MNAEQEDTKTVKVFSGTELEVNLLKGLLDQIGVSGLIQNESKSGILSGFLGGVQDVVDFYIQEADMEKSAATIKEFTEQNK